MQKKIFIDGENSKRAAVLKTEILLLVISFHKLPSRANRANALFAGILNEKSSSIKSYHEKGYHHFN